jgi:hypothetical protein
MWVFWCLFLELFFFDFEIYFELVVVSSSSFNVLFLEGFFGHTGVWIQGLTLARQVLYHFSHSSSPNTLFLDHCLQRLIYFISNFKTPLFLLNLFTIFFLFYFWYWGLNSGPSPWVTPPAQFFVMSIFERGSCELFARAGFELQSSWSLLPE